VFLPLPQFSHGAEKLETKDFPETQMFRPLDIFKPYQRPKAEPRRNKPPSATAELTAPIAVGSSAVLGVIVVIKTKIKKVGELHSGPESKVGCTKR
jgi:hypothetical protein